MQGISNTPNSSLNTATIYASDVTPDAAEEAPGIEDASGNTLFETWQRQAEIGGNSHSSLAALVLRFATQRQQSDSLQRDAAEAQATRFEELQVQQMRDKADQMRADAALQLTVGLVAASAQGLTGASGAVGAGARVAAGAAEAVGGYLGNLSKSHAVEADADISESEHHAASAKRRLEELGTDRSAANDLLSAALDFLREANKTEAETERAMFIRG